MKKFIIKFIILFVAIFAFAFQARAGEIEIGLFSPKMEKKISNYLGTHVPKVVNNLKNSQVWEPPPVIIKVGENVIFIRYFIVLKKGAKSPKVYVSWKKIPPDNFRRVLDIVGDNSPLGKGGVARLK